MGIKIFRRLHQVRMASQGGKEVTIPPGAPLKVGDTVVAIYGASVLSIEKWDRLGFIGRVEIDEVQKA